MVQLSSSKSWNMVCPSLGSASLLVPQQCDELPHPLRTEPVHKALSSHVYLSVLTVIILRCYV